MYQFSAETEELALEVINRLSRFKNVNSIWNIPHEKTVMDGSHQDSSEACSEENSIGMSQAPTAMDVDTPERLTQLSQRRVCVKRSISTDDSTESQPSQKKAKVELGTDLPELDTIVGTTDIPADLVTSALRLKESWYSEQNVHADDLAVLLCPPQQVEAVYSVLNLSELPEKCLSETSRHIISVATSISYTNSLAYMRHAVLPKIVSLAQSGSRLLLTTLTELCEHFPSQIVEAVLVPCITSQLENHQADLIVKLVKVSLDDNFKSQIIGKCTKTCYDLNEATISVYQGLLDCKCSLDATSLHQLVELFAHNSMNHTKNLKYGKLIMAVVTKHGKQINAGDLGTLQHVVDTHKSFLQKSLKTTLKKLQAG